MSPPKMTRMFGRRPVGVGACACATAVTGEERSYPSSARFARGNAPCHVFAISRLPGVNFSPQANSPSYDPPRAANSHSASVGNSLPAR
jgi:hypothetical protein